MTLTEAFSAFEMDELRSEQRSESTMDNYRKTCNSLIRSLDDLHVQLFAYNHILAWKKDMYQSGIEVSYMALHLRNLRRVLTYLKSHGFSVLDPAEIKIPKFAYNETAWLTIDEVRRFLSVIDSPRDKALFALQFSSGARIFELLSLTRDSIVDGRAEVIGKGKIKGVLEFDSNALNLLDDYLATRKDKLPYLFISNQKRPIHYSTIHKLAHRYAEEAGIKKNVTTHVFRHSFGTNLESNGMDIYKISKQMRHSKVETTKIYLHAKDINKRADYDKYHTPTPL